jgi:TRAP-type C4-dicarboxylate transport system permease small subunit
VRAQRSVPRAELPPRSWRRTQSVSSTLALVGGAAVVVGSWLPWMSFFAGLRPLSGLIGLNGRLLLVAGVAGICLGVARLPRHERKLLRWISVALGAAVSAAAGWLLAGVWQLTHQSGSGAMLVPRAGPGLVVVLLGGAMLVAAGAMPRGARQALTRGEAPTWKNEVG